MAKMSRAQAELAEQKYRPLKKKIKKSFGKIKDWVAKNELPPQSLLEEFLAEVNVMVSYPGFGDKHYDDFSRACYALKIASDAKDIELFSKRLKKISRIKKECHGSFK